MKKELIGKTPSGTAIYRVDGPEVRNTLDINFALGAHGLIKDYIPKDEIWLEGVPDECANMGHEIREYERMKGAGLPYDKAHEEANQYEHQLRQSGTCSVADLLKTPANPGVKALTGDIWNRMTPAERENLRVKAKLEYSKSWIEYFPEEKRALIREFKKEQVAIPKAEAEGKCH